MIERRHVENFLKLNGLTPDADDKEIKSLLISARWHEDDVETALVVLRENPHSHEQQIHTMRQFHQHGGRLTPETISSLLGIDVNLDQTVTKHRQKLQNSYRRQVISMVVLSILLSGTFLLGAIWYLNIDFTL